MSGPPRGDGERRAAGARIRERLAGSLPPAAVEFAAAVVQHLAGAPDAPATSAGEREVAREVEGLLAAVEAEGGAAGENDLAASPELLASVFQNIDLLYAAGYPHADRLSLLVMEAIAQGERREAERNAEGGGA